MGNPQLSINKVILNGIDQSKSLFLDSRLRSVIRKNGISDPSIQTQIIRNSKFFRQDPIELHGIGLVWVLLRRNIVADLVINTQTAEVKTIDESLA